MSISDVGHEFAKQYTGLQDSISAQLALIKIQLQRQSVASLLQLAISMKPNVQKSKPTGDRVDKLLATTSELRVDVDLCHDKNT